MTGIRFGFLFFLALSLAVAGGSTDVTFSAQRAESGTDRPLLWKIHGEKPSYLFGTIHVPDDRVLALHPLVKAAFQASDAVYLEISLGQEEIAKVQRVIFLNQHQTLVELIPKDLFHQLQAVLRSKGLPMAPFVSMKIWAMVSTLTLLDYLPVIGTKPSLDLALYGKAQLEGKEVGGLETVEEQLGVFEQFSTREQVEFLRTTLREMQKPGKGPVERLVQLYLAGDLDALSREINRQMTKDEALLKKINRVMFTERDRRMADRIAVKVKASPEEGIFFAVGAAHLSRKDGIPARLSEKGFLIERVRPRQAR